MKNINKKTIAIILSIVVIVIIISKTTYSLFYGESIAENTENYSTGILSIVAASKTDTLSLNDAIPVTDEVGVKSTPYIFTITNNGNLNYKFDVKILSTGESNYINPQYIKVKVDNEEVKTLSELTDSIIKSNLFLEAGESIDIELRAWLSIDTPNTEIGKTFNSKIVTDGQAVYKEATSTNAIQEPSIISYSSEPKRIEISYDDTNIIEEVGNHYFKLNLANDTGSINGTSNVNVQACDNSFNCTGTPTTTIENGIWYKVANSSLNESVLIQYNSSTIIKGTTTARIMDNTNNYKENSKSILIDPTKINITYVSNSCGSPTPDNQIASLGQTITLSETTPQKTGYIFDSWNTNSDGTGTSYAASSQINISSQNQDDIILYAQCHPIKYTIYFHGNGNTSQKYYTSGSWAASYTNPSLTSSNTIFTSGYQVKYDEEYTLPMNRFVKDYYTLKGWAKTSGGTTVAYDDQEKIKNLASTDNAEVHLYAVWRKNKVTINFRENYGGSITSTTTTDSGDTYKWKINSSDHLIYRTTANSSTYKLYNQSVEYGNTIDITDYNYSKYLKITRTGYSTESGKEWKCYSGCSESGKTFSQSASYSPSAFCGDSAIKTGDCNVVLRVNWIDNIKPTIKMSQTTSKTYCTGTSVTLNCSDSGSGMETAKMVDNGYETSGTWSTSQYFVTPRTGNIATKVTCTDKAGNSSTETYYFKIVSCSSGSGSSSGCNSSYITCMGTASDATSCTNKGGYHYSYGDCYKKVCGTSCPSGWIKT